MKKVLSVFLSLLLGLTALVVPSAAEGAAVLTQGFEQDYEMQINSKWSIYTAANEADENVHGGSRSLHYEGQGNNTPVANLADDGFLLTVGKYYTVSLWVKVIKPAELPGNSNQTPIQLCEGVNRNPWGQKVQHNMLTVWGGINGFNEWQQISCTFKAQYAYLSFWTYGPYEYFVDDITATERQEVTVTFNANGGTAVSAITGVEGTEITMPANPTKEGCTFTPGCLLERYFT